MTTNLPIRRALLSVSDKTGLIDLARALVQRGVELLSTGGSAKAIREAGLPVRDVFEITGFPEMMDGRVKTLHPMVHGGLLALRDDPSHVAAMEKHNIGPIDLLVVNLYPFEATVAKGADYDTCVENKHQPRRPSGPCRRQSLPRRMFSLTNCPKSTNVRCNWSWRTFRSLTSFRQMSAMT